MYTRPISFNERFYLATDRITSPFCNQMIYEGYGTFDVDRWIDAVDIASRANPGSRVVSRGFLSFSKWIDSGISPRLRVADGSSWTGMSDEGAPFLQQNLDPATGPSCEVVLIQGDVQRVAFRTHHSVMDGRGTMFWAEDVFRVLRGEVPVGSDSSILDWELAEKFKSEGRFPPPHEFIAPTGKADPEGSGVTWIRRRINGKFSDLLSRLAVLAAAEARRHSEGKVRITIPVDLRRREPGIRSTGNLSNPIYILVAPESTAESVSDDIDNQLKNFNDCMIYKREKILKYVPLWITVMELKKIIKDKHRNGLYHNSGIISNLGKLDTKKYSGGGFTASSWFAVPPCQDIVPFFMVVAGTDSYVDITAGMPKVLASNGRLEAFLDNIAANI